MIDVVAEKAGGNVDNDVMHIFDFNFIFGDFDGADGVVGTGTFLDVPIEVCEALVVVWVNDGEQAFSEGDFSEWEAVKDASKNEQNRREPLFEEDCEVK
jgi:hypothetical protein